MSATVSPPLATSPTTPPHGTIPQLLAWRAGHDGDRAFLVVDGEPLSLADPDRLAGQVAARLADYKVPHNVVVVLDVPVTSAGKVAKAELRHRPGAGS